MLQLDQRGGNPGSMGCTDDLLVDRMVFEDAQFRPQEPNLHLGGLEESI